VAVYPIADDVHLISRCVEVRGAERPSNSLVIQAQRPVVIDTVYPPQAEGFLEDLGSILDPATVTFVAITHADPDHTGALVRLLFRAPNARILTNDPGMQKLMGDFGLPRERFKLINPGMSVDLGDRTLSAHWVPLFDQPETMGFFDHRSRVFHASDCFGAITDRFVPFADQADPDEYHDGFRYWNLSNHHWVRFVDPAKFAPLLDAIRALQPSVIVSTHGPAIRKDIEQALAWLAELPEVGSFDFPPIDGETR